MAKVNLEVPDGIMKFLTKLGDFTGTSAEEYLETQIKQAAECILGDWPSLGLILGASADDLREKYKIS